MSERILIVGAGKVGRGLALAFRAAGLDVLGLHARTAGEDATSSGALGTALAGTAGNANVVVIAVSDGSVEQVCLDLVRIIRAHPRTLAQGTVVLTTSGTVAPTSFLELRGLGLACGTFHPLAAFATAERGAAAVRNGWIGIDGDATACATARRLSAALGARTIGIPDTKAAYHAAAVMASNFPVVLAAIATRILTDAGADERTSSQVVRHLMVNATANLAAGSPADVLTGPAARNDAAVIASHRAGIAYDADATAVYDALTRAAQKLAASDAPAVDDARVRRHGEVE